MLNINERIDIVPGTRWKIIQDKNKFSYGIDAILLSSFAVPKGRVIDIGTGTGIIPLRISNNINVDEIYGVEIQDEVAAMANRSVHLNGLETKIKILNMDLKELKSEFTKDSVDTVITNPPYMKAGGALVNTDENFAISRHEIYCTLDDIMEISSYLLRPLGKFYMVHRPDRLVDIICDMRKYNIEPKEITFIQPKLSKKPNLLLIQGTKGGKVDLRINKPLIVYNEDNTYTEEIKEIYR